MKSNQPLSQSNRHNQRPNFLCQEPMGPNIDTKPAKGRVQGDPSKTSFFLSHTERTTHLCCRGKGSHLPLAPATARPWLPSDSQLQPRQLRAVRTVVCRRIVDRRVPGQASLPQDQELCQRAALRASPQEHRKHVRPLLYFGTSSYTRVKAVPVSSTLTLLECPSY